MSFLLRVAGATSLAFTLAGALALTAPGLARTASSDANTLSVAPPPLLEGAQPGDTIFTPDAVDATHAPMDAEASSEAASVESPRHASLAEAVRAKSGYLSGEEADAAELRCLAIGVYFESKGEPLDGQLAVAHVIRNRAQSGRFASSYCGVLAQRGQFSFVRGGVIPTAPANAQWRTAVAIARIAHDGEWDNPAPGALFFHAARVSPRWGHAYVARLGNHIFYR